MILGDMHRRNAKLYPNQLAVVDGELRLTFRQLDDRVNRLANALRARGLKKGDRMAILGKNCSQYLEFYGAVEKGGFVAVPLNFRLSVEELAELINDSGPEVLFVQPEFFSNAQGLRTKCPSVKHYIALEGSEAEYEDYEEMLERASPADLVVDIAGDDVAYVIYTSGTTGLPRGAMLTHSGQLENAKCLLMELDMVPGDVYLAAMPLFHVGGRAISLAHTYRGAANVVMRDFDPEGMLRLLQQERVTCVQVVPTMIAFMLDLPNALSYDLSSVRNIFYASAPMPMALLRRGMEAFGPIFFQGYGQTESGPVVSVLHKQDHKPNGTDREVKKLSSCGLPAINVQARVVTAEGRDVAPGEVGEITAKSEWIMKGYWRKPEMTAEALRDGWLYTGDMATVDEDGYMYIVDRKKDMIISGGENIYPREIEEVLYRHPAVLEASVIGVPDDKWGEAVKAIVVLKSNAQATEAQIFEYCKSHLASYKKPKSVDFAQSLPKTPSGKTLKRELREQWWKGQDRMV